MSLRQLNFRYRHIALTSLLFALNPVILVSSQQAQKDTVSMICCIFLIGQLIKIVTTKNQCFTKIRFIIGFALTGWVMLEVRKNLIPIYLVIAIIVLIVEIKNKNKKHCKTKEAFARDSEMLRTGTPTTENHSSGLSIGEVSKNFALNRRVKTTISFATILILIGTTNFAIGKILHPTPAPISEAMSVPFQQVGAAFRNGKLDTTDSEFFLKIHPYEVWQKYQPINPNKLKGSGLVGAFDGTDTAIDFIKHWINVGIDSPEIYAKAFEFQSGPWWKINFGLWYQFRNDTGYWLQYNWKPFCGTKLPSEPFFIKHSTGEERMVDCYENYAKIINPKLDYSTYKHFVQNFEETFVMSINQPVAFKYYDVLQEVSKIVGNIALDFYIILGLSILMFILTKVLRKLYKKSDYKKGIPSFYLICAVPLIVWLSNILFAPRTILRYALPYEVFIPVFIAIVIWLIKKLVTIIKINLNYERNTQDKLS